MSTFQTNISYYKNVTDRVGIVISLNAFLFNQRTEHVERIKAVRAVQDKESRDALKKNLPGATISGVFAPTRAAANVTEYNGLICLDFDAKDNPEKTPAQIIEMLSEFSEVAYAGVSVSGQGAFCIMKTDNKDVTLHGKLCEGIMAVFADKYGLIADKSCKDVCRLRFISYDPNAWVNQIPGTLYTHLFLNRTAKSTPVEVSQLTTKQRVEMLISKIVAVRTDITEGYQTWVKVGFSLAAEFGESGRSYFHDVSQISGQYKHEETDKQYSACLSQPAKATIATLFEIAKNKGIWLKDR